MNKLKGKVAIITGASRGIGRAIAEAFEAEGARLMLTAKDNMSLLQSFRDAKIVKLDLACKEDIDVLVSETLKAFGRIDILINNAAFFKQTDFEDISYSELSTIIDVDFKGPFLLLQQVLKQMQKQKSGKIINLSSGAAKLGSSKASHYAALKAAMVNLTKSLAKIGGISNINVNAIAPGFIETDMIKEMLIEKKAAIEGVIPLAKIGTAKDIAGLALFLASDKSDYITGQVICVDGGHCMV